jgi:dimethylhistidine N-methyltransferase
VRRSPGRSDRETDAFRNLDGLPDFTRGQSQGGAAMLMPGFIDQATTRATDPRRELTESLGAPMPFIAPKLFYDRLGSALFTAICELPEYYPTRTEAAIFDANADEIAAAVGAGSTLIDLGAGDCAKAARLFASLAPSQYVAVDISVEFVRDALGRLQPRFPSLPMLGIGADFSQRLELPGAVRGERRVFFYPGSSIGNFAPAQAREFLRGLRGQVDLAGGLLLGVDLVKSKDIVEPAYDDALGVTAAFNLNVLTHVNRLIGSDFVLADWRHVALLNDAESRIEMHLEARRDLRVRWPGGERRFRAGDRIHTENSYKYRRTDLEQMFRDAGFLPDRCWTDDRGWFALFFARPDPQHDDRNPN